MLRHIPRNRRHKAHIRIHRRAGRHQRPDTQQQTARHPHEALRHRRHQIAALRIHARVIHMPQRAERHQAVVERHHEKTESEGPGQRALRPANRLPNCRDQLEALITHENRQPRHQHRAEPAPVARLEILPAPQRRTQRRHHKNPHHHQLAGIEPIPQPQRPAARRQIHPRHEEHPEARRQLLRPQLMAAKQPGEIHPEHPRIQRRHTRIAHHQQQIETRRQIAPAEGPIEKSLRSPLPGIAQRQPQIRTGREASRHDTPDKGQRSRRPRALHRRAHRRKHTAADHRAEAHHHRRHHPHGPDFALNKLPHTPEALTQKHRRDNELEPTVRPPATDAAPHRSRRGGYPLTRPSSARRGLHQHRAPQKHARRFPTPRSKRASTAPPPHTRRTPSRRHHRSITAPSPRQARLATPQPFPARHTPLRSTPLGRARHKKGSEPTA